MIESSWIDKPHHYMTSVFMCSTGVLPPSFIYSINLMTSSFNLACSASLTRAGINSDSKFKERVLGSRDCCDKCCIKKNYLNFPGIFCSSGSIEFVASPEKEEGSQIGYSCACSPRGEFFTYIWLCIVSIPQLAMRISASPSLIQAGQRGCQISRTILKYSTAVRD